jgi:hypothetical protein
MEHVPFKCGISLAMSFSFLCIQRSPSHYTTSLAEDVDVTKGTEVVQESNTVLEVRNANTSAACPIVCMQILGH